MRSRFPKLFEILRSAHVTTDIERGLTKEQHRVQAELRSQFNVDTATNAGTAGGICLPWYESRVASKRQLFRDRETGKVFSVHQERGYDAIDVTEERDLSATGSTSANGDAGGMTVGTEIPEIGAALRDQLVLESLGARVIGGLRGNVNFPRAKVDLSAAWLSESASAPDTAESLAKLDLSPLRITASMPVSDQLLIQGEGIEPFLRQELMTAVAVEAQRVIIAGTGGSQPCGILNTPGIGSVVGGANGAAPTYQNCCDLEFAVTGTAKADRGHVAWITSPAVRRKLRQTPLFSGGSVGVWRENEAYALLGRRAGVVTGCPDTLSKGSAASVCSALVCGEMSELFVAFWGPGIIVAAIRDTALARVGKTLLIATAYVNGGIRSVESFAAMLDVLAQ